MAVSRRFVLSAGVSAVGFATIASARENCGFLEPSESIDPPPEYLPGAPTRTSLLDDGVGGQRVRIFGNALTTKCDPLALAKLEFWQTDEKGNYDDVGYRLRAAQRTGTDGSFELETVMPGAYNGPRHIHFLLTTRIGSSLQPVILSGGIFFPTAEEYAARSPSRRSAEFLDPGSLIESGGVLLVHADIVVAVI